MPEVDVQEGVCEVDDQKESSPSLILWRLVEELGFEPSSVHGPYFWRLPNGRSLWEEAEAIEAGEKADARLDETLSIATHTARGVPAASAQGADGQVEEPGSSTSP